MECIIWSSANERKKELVGYGFKGFKKDRLLYPEKTPDLLQSKKIRRFFEEQNRKLKMWVNNNYFILRGFRCMVSYGTLSHSS